MNSSLINTEEAIIKINQELTSAVSRLKTDALSLSPRYANLWGSIENLINSGGKRFRPYMSLIAFKCFSDENYDSIIASVSAQELLHLALLVHDDIIDRDYIRYGVDNISGQYYKDYSKYLSDISEIRHYSDSAAILAGDLLISESYQMLILNAPRDIQLELMKIYQQSIFYVAGGELLDTESAFIEDLDSALKIAELKTAFYSFVTPLLIGATMAKADDNSIKILRKLGINLGIAYQLLDDDLGAFGDEKLTGKSSFSDLKEAKKTYMINEFNQIASKELQDEFNKHFGKTDLTDDEAKQLRKILIDSGARQKNLDKIQSLKDSILTDIDELPISTDKKDLLNNLLKLTLERNK